MTLSSPSFRSTIRNALLHLQIDNKVLSGPCFIANKIKHIWMDVNIKKVIDWVSYVNVPLSTRDIDKFGLRYLFNLDPENDH